MGTICSCEFENDVPTGILRCVTKCKMHKERKRRMPIGLSYYQKLGAVDHDGRPANVDCYISELKAYMGGIEPPLQHPAALLEIGCGMSPYVTYIQNMGYKYYGLDPDVHAINWVMRTYGVSGVTGFFPECSFPPESFDAIFMPHSLEHMYDAPSAIDECHKILKCDGVLYILVPDDSDKQNTDHWWFFTMDGLKSLLEKKGFTVTHTADAQIVAHEKFIYVKARKV